MNFKELDKQIYFKYYADLIQIVIAAGYSYVSEYIFKETQRGILPGVIASNLKRTTAGILYWKNKWNFSRKHGGYTHHKVKSKLDQQLIRATRIKGLPRSVTADAFDISISTVYRIHHKKGIYK